MQLTRVHIENFRGIKDLSLDLDDMIVLIGENNTGKTAVLEAIHLCLGKLGPRRRIIFDALDFHLKDADAEPSTADPIAITLTFSEKEVGDWGEDRPRRLKSILNVDATTQLSRVVLRVTCSFDADECDFKQNWDFLNEAGEAIPGRSEADLRQLQQEVAFYMLKALRDAGRNFDAKGRFWRPFLRDSRLPAAQKAEIETKLKEVNELVVSSHESFEKACERLRIVQNVVPMAANVVSIEAVPGRIFDMLAKAQVHLATTTGAQVPVGRHGEGTQSLAVLMLFAAFLDLDAGAAGRNRVPIVALEEPEAHLHPSAIRTLWTTIEDIPGQKLISTHSGDLLSQVPMEAVRRLSRGADGYVEAFRIEPETLDDKSRRMFDFHIRHARGELLFARCWLLGEGETEVTLFLEIARHLSIDLERAGVRCVPYRLGASIELFLKVARDLGIRCCALTDNDQQGQKDQKHVKDYAETAALQDVLHVMPEKDIEAHLCANGLGPVYEGFLTPRLQGRVTVARGDPDYWPQVLKAIKGVRGYKPAAALEVLEKIQAGAPVPPLLERVIRKAVELAGGA